MVCVLVYIYNKGKIITVLVKNNLKEEKIKKRNLGKSEKCNGVLIHSIVKLCQKVS